ncbi:inclusion body family protein [Streptomyces sp. NPDC030392]|uniref:inclusion body family protein n=1 Tax=Streptomyces sp. NPDC030392 TaxID=3155468 RepID=UPI003403A50E
MPTSQIINVLIAFDCESILERYRNPSMDPDHPTWVDPQYILMTTRQDRIIGSPGGELNFRAEVEDIIRWRETTLSLDDNYSALLYRYESNAARLLTDPEPVVVDTMLPYPNPDAPKDSPSFLTQRVKSHYWRADVRSVGSVTYHFSFQILDGTHVRGYFAWDPFITIE